MSDDFWLMSPLEAIEILRKAGMNDTQIGAACNTTQATINRIRNKRHPEPSYLIADALRMEVSKRIPTLSERYEEPRRETILDKWRASRASEVND